MRTILENLDLTSGIKTFTGKYHNGKKLYQIEYVYNQAQAELTKTFNLANTFARVDYGRSYILTTTSASLPFNYHFDNGSFTRGHGTYNSTTFTFFLGISLSAWYGEVHLVVLFTLD